MSAEENWTNFVVFDGSYIPMAECWFKWFQKHPSPNLLKVGCMDSSSCEEASSWETQVKTPVEVLNELEPNSFLEGHNLNHPSRRMVRSQSKRSIKSGWPKDTYINMFHQMIWDTLKESQKGLLHLDVDALWLRRPDQHLKRILQEHPDVDIIASSSTEANPQDLVDKWGFVLNVGFILYRFTENVQSLFTFDLLPAQKQSCQQLLNYALDQKGCTWSGRNTTSRDQVGHCGKIKVVALSQTFVSRRFDYSYDAGDDMMPAIAHPDTGLLKFEGINRMQKFEEMNLC